MGIFLKLFLRIRRRWRHNPFLMVDAIAEEEKLVSHGWGREEAHRIAMGSYDAIINASQQFIMVDCQCKKLRLIDSGIPPRDAYRLVMDEYRRITGG